MPRRVTLKDIAHETGLSESAVSQVLNGRDCRLSDESKRAIRECAKRMGYHANKAARSLATKRSDTVGLIVPDIANPFFASLIKHLEEGCERVGLGLLICDTGDDGEKDLRQLERMGSLGIDGIVYVPSREILDADALSRLRGALDALGVPFVMLDRIVEGIDCDKVLIDNALSGIMGTRYLLERGHRRVGCLANTKGSRNGQLRLNGYYAALAEAGIPADPALVVECSYHAPDGYKAIDALRAVGATALFSTSDMVTAGALRRLSELGLRVPEDFAVVSFDRNEISRLFVGDIVSVTQEVGELTDRALGLLRERISGKKGDFELCVLEPGFFEGEDTWAA